MAQNSVGCFVKTRKIMPMGLQTMEDFIVEFLEEFRYNTERINLWLPSPTSKI